MAISPSEQAPMTARIEFFFDLSSPWTRLAFANIAPILAAADFFAGAAAFFAGAAADFFAGAAIVVALADLRAAGFFGGVGIGRSSEHQVNGENTDRPRMASFGGGVHGSSRN